MTLWHWTSGLVRGAIVVSACLASVGCGAPVPSALATRPGMAEMRPAARLKAFGSEAELRAFLRAQAGRPSAIKMSALAPSSIGRVNQAALATSVTNVQHAGIDEGDIVKVHGDHLVVLRRGRLFTVRVGDARLTPVSTVDAFAPDIDPRHAWYDEMLIAGDTVVVIGYSYERGGTELGLFDIDRTGHLAHRATYHLRSSDYYASRNYASRLIGQRLILYTPLMLTTDATDDPLTVLPALRKWEPGRPGEFVPIYSPRRLYRPLTSSRLPALHTIISCDLGQPELVCTATGVMGPLGRVFYVAPSAVYVWTVSVWGSRGEGSGWLYRLPLYDSEPGAVRVSGSPIDQFSFLEDAENLHVLVRTGGAGEAMWRSEMAPGDMVLVRVPLSSFGAEVGPATLLRYRALPGPTAGRLQNRFVGNHLLYGASDWWTEGERGSALFVHDYAAGTEPVVLPMRHGVERIEALGDDALVVGSERGTLHFSTIRLGRRPAVVGRYALSDAVQGEWRSHGFFYRPDGPGMGILGLPVRAGEGRGPRYLTETSASVLFLRNEALTLRELGSLNAEAPHTISDGCRASCVDWYGNARPLFLPGRILALLGYEIVEGELNGGRIQETRRVDVIMGAKLSR